MILPVRCFTCGKVLADKWRAYERMCAEADEALAAETEGAGGSDSGSDAGGTSASASSASTAAPKTRARYLPARYGPILDALGIARICCRRHMLGHVDL
jgi:DNA-directed RNA polymerase subunit N (RpoN/RPB10)